ncbi:DUF3906 family protein [Bacillus sp. CGMCC 1.16541]|uniref:DUF3906 family protein n=1 Tax=Bacillus sp. CGMCC 1.16541 TaxID=2185143 RepID=UPI000D7267FD|nr:DUF3906 family protein [Bacillus sp. CGMCC 1.16541]
MHLYRFEVTIEEQVIYVVIVANSDEHAFELVDIELEKHYLKMPNVKETVLYEKKRIRGGTGFVLGN